MLHIQVLDCYHRFIEYITHISAPVLTRGKNSRNPFIHNTCKHTKEFFKKQNGIYNNHNKDSLVTLTHNLSWIYLRIFFFVHIESLMSMATVIWKISMHMTSCQYNQYDNKWINNIKLPSKISHNIIMWYIQRIYKTLRTSSPWYTEQEH